MFREREPLCAVLPSGIPIITTTKVLEAALDQLQKNNDALLLELEQRTQWEVEREADRKKGGAL